MSVLQNITLKKSVQGNNRYISIAGTQRISLPQPIVQKLNTALYPEGWEDGLSSDEFLTATKQMLRKKFDEKNQIS